MAGADKVFLRAFRWFKTSVDALAALAPDAVPDAIRSPLADALRGSLGLQLDKDPASVDPAALTASHAVADSLAVAALVTGESLAALRLVGEVLDALQAGSVGLGELGKVMQQVERIVHASAGQPPTAYSLAKLLLIVSGDADEDEAAPPARRLVHLLKGRDPATQPLAAADVAEAQMIAGLAVIALGTIADRAFASLTPGGVVQRGPLELPATDRSKTFELVADGPNRLQLTLGYEGSAAPPALYAKLDGQLGGGAPVSDGFRLGLDAGGAFVVRFALPPLDPLPASLPVPTFSGDIDLGLSFGRRSATAPLRLGPADGTHLSIGELSGSLRLTTAQPRLGFDLKDAKLVLKVGDDPFLGAVIGDAIEVKLNFGLVADVAGGLRLADGTGLRATVPLEAIPSSPVQIPFLHLELLPGPTLDRLSVELSGSFQAALGPFAGSIERLGTLLVLDGLQGGAPTAQWKLKPPTGAGLSIDAGIVKGGGFLLFDEPRGEYAGILDLKLMAVGVKAIALLSTKNPAGWSLLLIITAQLPPIQLGFGFTLTGVGGLIGVQHTVSIEALSSGLTTGSLDSFLFPQNPVANAPQIISQLRTIFPFKPGGFVIGPMLELGWGTPSLVTARVGVLVEATQLVFVGQVIVQLPPLVDKSLSLLYLQVDFAGGIVFDPLQIWFDGVLRDSRVVFISLTGQFAFRARFGDRPSFLISAGGFHPRFTDLPPGLPAPFQRVGASFSIGVIGLEFKGYFAVTSATVQGGASLRIWADIGIASVEGGFEFNAIIYLVPKFRFDCDLHVYAGVEVFGIDFASVDIYGRFAGPGRWHVTGRAKIHTPWPLPDFSLEVDEAWGEERPSPMRRLRLADELKAELEKPGTWSAALMPGAQASAAFAKLPATLEGGRVLLVHPDALLQFVQKRLPLAKRLDKLGSDAIEGEREVAIGSLRFAGVEKAPDRRLQESFSAAQFLELSEDELLGKPSFGLFEAGVEVGQRDYLFGTAVPEAFDYEEVNLSSKTTPSLLAQAGLLDVAALVALHHGAAGRSARRAAERRRPEVEARLEVKPPPLATLNLDAGTMAGQALAGAAASSYWHAEDAVRAAGGAIQVVEAVETLSL